MFAQRKICEEFSLQRLFNLINTEVIFVCSTLVCNFLRTYKSGARGVMPVLGRTWQRKRVFHGPDSSTRDSEGYLASKFRAGNGVFGVNKSLGRTCLAGEGRREVWGRSPSVLDPPLKPLPGAEPVNTAVCLLPGEFS